MAKRGTRAVLVALAAALLGGVAAAPAVAVTDIEPPRVGDPEDFRRWERQMKNRDVAARLPSSTLASTGSTASERMAGGRRHVLRAKQAAAAGAVPVPQGAELLESSQRLKAGVRRGVAGVGQLASVAFGVDFVYAGAGQVSASLYGVESQGLYCDLHNLFAGSTDCGVAAAPTYVPNEDVAGFVPGWVGGTNVFTTTSSGWPEARIRVDVVEAPEYGASMALGEVLPVRLVYSIVGGQCVNEGWVTPRHAGGPKVNAVSGPRDLGNFFSLPPGGPWLGYPDCGSRSVEHTWNWEVPNLSSDVNNGTWAGLYFRGTSSDDVQATTIHWLAPGHPERVEIAENPERWWQTEWTCSDGSSHARQSERYQETDETWPTPPEATCPDGAPTWLKVTQHTEGLDDPYLLHEYTTPPAFNAWAATYPECTDGSCILELHRLDEATGMRLSCFDNPALCAQWLSDPAKVDNYVCTYGAHDVALDECLIYGPTFDPAKAEPSTGTPATADPATGEGPAPGPGTGPGQPGPADCPPPFSWSAVWNNWWIFKAVGCALEEAFVPRESIDRLNAVDLTKKTPIPQVQSAATWIDPQVVGERCMVVDLDTPWQEVRAFDSCGDDPAVSWLRQHRPLFGIVLWSALVFGLAWWGFRTYAPGSKGVA